jgi:nitrogen regulatory protein P-II 1
MKKIEAIIKQEHLSALKTTLAEHGFVGMTVYPVKGHGSSGGLTLEWRAGSYTVDFMNHLLMMMVVADDRCQQAIDCIIAVCQQHHPGQIDTGMGQIIVSPVDKVISIRTGQLST